MTDIIPLELKTVYDARSKSTVPALNPRRTTDLSFVKFDPPNNPSVDQSVPFSEVVKIICCDLDELLSYDFEQFWCQMLYNRSLHSCMRSILSWAPRGLQKDVLPEDCRDEYRHMLTLILAVFHKASEPQGSETDFISKGTFGELIYDHFVFDLPTVMDLCAIYFHLGINQLITIVNNIFSYQDLYSEDLKNALTMLSEIFDRLEREINTPGGLKGFDRLQDLTFYIGDISWTVFTFFNVLSQATIPAPSNLCYSYSMHEKLPALYEHSLMALRTATKHDSEITPSQREALLLQLSKASAWLVITVRCAFCEPHLLNKIRDLGRKPGSSQCMKGANLGQNYLDFMIQLLNYRNFSLAYQLFYPFEQDLIMIRRTGGQSCLDDAAVQYVLGAIESLVTEAGVDLQPLPFNICENPSAEQTPCETQQPGPSINGPVREVIEVLPDMDISLIQRCLDAFGQDSARVINAALEGSIPEHLLNPPDQSGSGASSTLSEEFRMAHVADRLRIPKLKKNEVWQGKRNDSNILPELNERLKRITVHSAVSIWENVEDDDRGKGDYADDRNGARIFNTLNEYEDEYDDTYEVHEGAVDNVGSSSESDHAELSDQADCDTPAVRQQQRQNVPNPPTNRNDLRHTSVSQTPVLHIENPEVIRQRQQLQRAHRRGRYYPQYSHSIRSDTEPQPERTSNAVSNEHDSVTGTRSGTKATADISSPGIAAALNTGGNDWKYKNAHKGRLANHNRRRLADKKRQF